MKPKIWRLEDKFLRCLMRRSTFYFWGMWRRWSRSAEMSREAGMSLLHFNSSSDRNKKEVCFIFLIRSSRLRFLFYWKRTRKYTLPCGDLFHFQAISRMGGLWKKLHTVWVNVGGLHAGVYLLKRTAGVFGQTPEDVHESPARVYKQTDEKEDD